MADITDVADALVALIAANLQPNGAGEAGAYSPPVKIYAGWPDPQTLDADLKTAGSPLAPKALHVSVFKLQMERDTTRYNDEWMEAAVPTPTYDASIVGNTITITGAAPDPYVVQNIGVGIDARPPAYVYTAAEDDTPSDIAAGLAAVILADVAGVTVLGPVITIPPPFRINFARVAGIGSAMRELARSETGFQVTVWANNHAQRTALAKRLEPLLAAVVRLPMPDGSSARLIRRGSTDDDGATRQGAYRRDLVYSVEYAITETVEAPEIVAMEVELKDPTGAVIAETLE